jgi:hypothetical protein
MKDQERDGRNLGLVYFLKNHIAKDDWQSRYIRGNVVIYVVLGKPEQHVPYRELIGTTECVTL